MNLSGCLTVGQMPIYSIDWALFLSLVGKKPFRVDPVTHGDKAH